jgi:hypothetical protein
MPEDMPEDTPENTGSRHRLDPHRRRSRPRRGDRRSGDRQETQPRFLLVFADPERAAAPVLRRSRRASQNARGTGPLPCRRLRPRPARHPPGRRHRQLRAGGAAEGRADRRDHGDEPHPRDRRGLRPGRGRRAHGRHQRGADPRGMGNGHVPLDAGHRHHRRLRRGRLAGIGSIANGRCARRATSSSSRRCRWRRNPSSMSSTPRRACSIHHAWGLNGAITEVTLRTVPTRDWVGCMAGFDSYRDCLCRGIRAGQSDEAIARKLCSVVDARIAATFPGWKATCRRARICWSRLSRARTARQFPRAGRRQWAARSISPWTRPRAWPRNCPMSSSSPTTTPRFRCSNPTAPPPTSRSACPTRPTPTRWRRPGRAGRRGLAASRVHARRRAVYCADLPIIWFRAPNACAEIDGIYEAHGFTVYDATCERDRGRPHAARLPPPRLEETAWTPRACLNPGKSRAWAGAPPDAEEIEAQSLKD